MPGVKAQALRFDAGYQLAQRGVGQSVWIGIGGDPVKGMCYADLVPFFAADALAKSKHRGTPSQNHEHKSFVFLFFLCALCG